MKKIAIHSVPRSGSSWLGEIINSSEYVNYSFQPLFSYELKSYLSPESSKGEIEQFFTKLKSTNDDFIRQKQARISGIKPQFNKVACSCIAYKEVRYHHIIENLLRKTEDIKIIGLVRNPLSVMSSWYNAPREFRKDLGWKFDEELLLAAQKNQGKVEEYYGLQKWIEVTKDFERLSTEYADRFCLVEYKDLLQDTKSEVSRIFKFSDLEITNQVFEFIDSKHSNKDTYSVFKNKLDDKSWMTNLPKKYHEIIRQKVIESGLEQYL